MRALFFSRKKIFGEEGGRSNLSTGYGALAKRGALACAYGALGAIYALPWVYLGLPWANPPLTYGNVPIHLGPIFGDLR